MKNCGHNNINCGCKDTYLTTPPACPEPAACPDAQPCSEVFDAGCIIYTGADILCGQTVVVEQNSTVAAAIEAVVDYFCTAGAAIVIPTNITCGVDTVVTAGTLVNAAIEDVVAYFCQRFEDAPVYDVVAGSGISVTENTVGNTTTFTVASAVTLVNTGFGEPIANDTTGPGFSLRSLVEGAGISITTNADDLTIASTGPQKYTNSANFFAGVPTTVNHNLNSLYVVVSLVSSAGLPYTSYVHGTDYTYTIVDADNISLTFVAGGFANITVIG